MQSFKWLHFQLALLSMVAFVSSCAPTFITSSLPSEDINTTGRSRITFNTNGTTAIDPMVLEFTQPSSFPLPPTKEGVTFLGWYFDDGTFLQPFNLEILPFAPIPKEVTLHAKWSRWINGIEHYNFPFFHLTTSIPLEWINHDEYQSGSVSISNTSEANILNEESLEIRGRGNGSWGYEKKGYRLKFGKKVSLFGEMESRHWVLTPGGHDFGTLRNHVAYGLANRVFNRIEYTTSSHYVELFVNGTYHGVYNIFEHIRVQEGRVDIPSKYGVIDTGYLLEYDAYAEGTPGVDHFFVEGLKYPFGIKSPDPKDYATVITPEVFTQQVLFIQNYMQQVTDAILMQDWQAIIDLVDIDSMIDMYLLHEFFKNTDTGWSSFYVYKKPQGKLFFGPAWDFDFTSGISRGDSSYEGLYVGHDIRFHSDFTSSEYYLTLMQMPTFVQEVQSRYLDLQTVLPFHLEDLFIVTIIHQPSFRRDGNRWHWLANWRREQQQTKTWLRNRYQWMLNWASNAI